MIKTDVDHYAVVNACLQGLKATDEQTFASAAVLQERLERIKQTYPVFAGITMSPYADRLQAASNLSAVS